ncbi:MAG: nucleotidyltransferase domain-containing protein [bacterium]
MEYKKNSNKYFLPVSSQKVLDFLAYNSGKKYTEREIVKGTGVKKSAVNLSLRELADKKIIKKEKIGRTSIYKADENNFVLKEIKILQNILLIFSLVEKLKQISQKIILFGSCANGDNTSESDIDLFIQTNNPDSIRKIINSLPSRDKIQAIIKTPKEMLLINKNKPLFFQEIEKGRVLWENYG